MEKIYNSKDIQSFLLEKNIFWDGENKKPGTEESHYEQIVADVILPNERKTKEVIFDVSPISLVVTEELGEDCYEDCGTSINEIADFSYEWMVYLIKKSPQNAQILKDKAIERISFLNDGLEEKLKGLGAQMEIVKLLHKKSVAPWNDILEKANAALQQVSHKAEPESE